MKRHPLMIDSGIRNRAPLAELFVANRGVGSFRAELNEAGEGEIFIYDHIVGSELEAEWFGGVSAGWFIAQLRQYRGRKVRLRINSPGGEVFAARAIEQAIREHDAEIIAQVDGLAASAASTIAIAAARVVMAPGSFFMIHRSATIAWGNVSDFEAVAVLLGKMDQSIAELYAAKAGGEAAGWLAQMDAETWFTAAEAIEAGLADAMADSADEAEAENRVRAWNLAAYRHSPIANAVPPAPVETPPVPVAEQPENIVDPGAYRAENDADNEDEQAAHAELFRALEVASA